MRLLNLKKVRYNHDIYKICLDSRLCVENSIFFAIDGKNANGDRYIYDAISKGAKTIICENEVDKIDNINYVLVDNVRKTLALAAKYYYNNVSKYLKIIGVVGTNGKTSITTIAHNFFEYLGLKSMLIGSNGVFLKNYEYNLENTTPDVLTLYQYFTLAKKEKVKYVFMEVSSIAIDQYRVFGIDFDCLIMSNFSQDHLDYHKTIDNYLFCKVLPFITLKENGHAIINVDDANYKHFTKFCKGKIYTYGLKNKTADYYGIINSVDENGISFYAKKLLFKSKLLGKFNLYNLLAVMPICEIFHINLRYYIGFLHWFKFIEGRMNLIKIGNKNVILDYAHTYSATTEIITETLNLCKGNLHIIIGCGGNREKEKRFMIGKYLNEISVNIILTTDNPRFEDPELIIEDIKSQIDKDIKIIVNRKEAILYGLNNLKENDYLLVIGKGCEKYIDIRGTKYPYSDLEVINEFIHNQ